jgi:subfamily B ATP-binding cassette protein MsbA
VLNILPPTMEFIGGIAFVGALWYGSQEIAAGRLTTGQFTAFITALFMMYAPAKKLSRVNANVQQALAASERIFDILDTHSEVEDRPGAPPAPPFRRAIEFCDVRFSYAGAEGATLDGVSLTVNEVEDEEFTVFLIPHTLKATHWDDAREGTEVNLEVDQMARYAARLASTA